MIETTCFMLPMPNFLFIVCFKYRNIFVKLYCDKYAQFLVKKQAYVSQIEVFGSNLQVVIHPSRKAANNNTPVECLVYNKQFHDVVSACMTCHI